MSCYAYEVLSDSHKYYDLAAIFILSHLLSLMFPLFGSHIGSNWIQVI